MSGTYPAIEIDRVTKRFPGVLALDEVTFSVVPGEVHAVVGENGAGKSTLMKLLAGVICDFEGRMAIGGQGVRFRDTRDAQRYGVSIIHQELNLVEQLSAAANIFLGRERRNRLGLLDERRMNREAAALLSQLECQIEPERMAGTLRVGDQQLVEIAKSLSLDASILILDEPTSALTEAETARLFRVLERLKARGVTMLYISHKLDEVFRLCDRITVLRDGRHVATCATRETTPREITHRMVGREIELLELPATDAPRDVVLEVERLHLPWPGHARRWRLEDISFTLRRGEVLGIAGLMGAGRTELLECLFGAAPAPHEGVVRLEGRQVRFSHPAEARAAGVALVTEDRKRLGIFEQLDLAANMSLCTLGDYRRAGLVSRTSEHQAVASMAKRLGVKTAGLQAAITSLSGGNQQKAILGRWLLAQPRVLLLDDPTRGIDVGAKAELYRLIRALCQEGLGVIVTSSELPELLALCDRILVLAEGRLTGEFTRATASEQAIMEAATRTAHRAVEVLASAS